MNYFYDLLVNLNDENAYFFMNGIRMIILFI